MSTPTKNRALSGTVFFRGAGGAYETRTHDLFNAIEAL